MSICLVSVCLSNAQRSWIGSTRRTALLIRGGEQIFANLLGETPKINLSLWVFLILFLEEKELLLI